MNANTIVAIAITLGIAAPADIAFAMQDTAIVAGTQCAAQTGSETLDARATLAGRAVAPVASFANYAALSAMAESEPTSGQVLAAAEPVAAGAALTEAELTTGVGQAPATIPFTQPAASVSQAALATAQATAAGTTTQASEAEVEAATPAQETVADPVAQNGTADANGATTADPTFAWQPVERDTSGYSYIEGQENGQKYADLPNADPDFVWQPIERDTASYSYVTGQANGAAHADDEGDPKFVWQPVDRDTASYGYQNGRTSATERLESYAE